MAEEIGSDGRDLLEKVYTSTSHAWLQELPAIERVRCIWIQQYHASVQGAAWRKDQELPPSALLFQSPYDIEARYSKKKNTGWVGYKVHFTEGCDPDQPHFLLEVTTTPATTPDGDVMEELHERLAEKKLLPNQHLVAKGYVDAEMLAKSQQVHQIDIVGPALPDTSWSSQEAERFDHSQFSIDWEAKSVLCPAGHKSRDWGHIPDRHGKPSLRIRFPLPYAELAHFMLNVRQFQQKYLFYAQINRAFRRFKKLVSGRKHQNARALYAKRAGVEGTVAQAVRTCEIRRARSIGLKKLNLQAFLTASSMNVLRACHWVVEEQHASTPSSCFAKLVASVQHVPAA